MTQRLGYISGQLIGYENKDDLRSLLKPGKEKIKAKLDEEKMAKYGSGNLAQLSIILAEAKAKENHRKKRLEKEPEGFVLNDNKHHSCKVCYRSVDGSQAWWTLPGVTCLDCHNNIKAGVIPAEILENNKIWFTSSDIQSEFSLHAATVGKLVRNNVLVGRDLKDSDSKEYFTIFMVEDNKEFLATHPRKGERKQRRYYIDEKGEIIWL